MPTIRITGIGAIADTGAVNVTPMTLVVGRQSSGKSTFMKVLCMCQWVEKKLMAGDPDFLYSITHYGRFIKELKSFFRLDDSFFSDRSSIEYDGVAVGIKYGGGRNVRIERRPGAARHNTKLCFIPSERNVATVMPNFDRVYRSQHLDVIFNYFLEYQEARTHYRRGVPLAMPFDGDVSYYYDEASDDDRVVVGRAGGELRAAYASSGLQSAIPLTVLVDYASRLVGRQPAKSVSDISSLVKELMLAGNRGGGERSSIAKAFADAYTYRGVKFYIEEPELNLFPASQYDMVRFIVGSIARTAGPDGAGGPSGAVMTTHSPYVLTSLNHLMRASVAKAAGHAVDVPALPLGSFSAYRITEEGTFEDIVDHGLHFIKGDYLDSISDFLQDADAKLDDMIYGDAGFPE